MSRLVAAGALLGVAPAARASILGEENVALATLVAQGTAELTRLSDAIATAKQQLQLARDVYAGVNDFAHFDTEAFLEEQRRRWLSELPLASEVEGLVTDLGANGLGGGHFGVEGLVGRFDVFRERARREAGGAPRGRADELYDVAAAVGLSREVERALASAATRARLAAQPEPESVTQGLVAAEAARQDPRLVALYLRRRAQAKEAEHQAFNLLAEAMGASPGKAQQVAAMATGLSAQQLARIDDKLGESLTLEQLDAQRRATVGAAGRLEAEALWKELEQGARGRFRSAEGAAPAWEAL